MSRYYKLSNGKRLVFPDDATPQEMESIVAQFEKASQPLPPAKAKGIPPEAFMAMEAANPNSLGPFLMGRGRSHLSDVGGAAGGLLGGEVGPVSYGLAGLGGMAGKAGEQALEGRFSPKEIAAAGVTQAAAQAAGAGLGKLGTKAATGLWKGSIGMSKVAAGANKASAETQLILRALKANMPLRAQVMRHILENPTVMRRLSMSLHDVGPITRQSPRILADLFLKQLTSAEPDATQP